MRLIARNTLMAFWTKHSEAKPSLDRWERIVRMAEWATMDDVQSAFPKAKVLNGERVRFEVAGGDYRLVASFKFKNRLVFVKFIGSHAEYDRIDALTVSLY